MLSRPSLPLGVKEVRGKRRCVLFPPYEEAEPEQCPICMGELRWNRFYDLECGHEVCCECMRRYAIHRSTDIHTDVSWPCPICRRNTHKIVRVLGGLVPGERGLQVLHCIADCFGNWHTVLVEVEEAGGLVTLRVLGDFKRPAFLLNATTWISPYSGWIARHRRPAQNPDFAVVPHTP